MTIQDFIKIGVGIILVVTLVAIPIGIYHKSKPIIDKGTGQFEAMANIEENELKSQNNKTVSGQYVIDTIKKWQDGEITATISYTTGEQTTAITVETSNISNAFDRSDKGYINPSKKFSCTVTTNKNGVISSVLFDQK